MGSELSNFDHARLDNDFGTDRVDRPWSSVRDPNWPPKDGDDLENAILRLEGIITGWGRSMPSDVVKGLSQVVDLLHRKQEELKDEADQAWGDAFDRDQ